MGDFRAGEFLEGVGLDQFAVGQGGEEEDGEKYAGLGGVRHAVWLCVDEEK